MVRQPLVGVVAVLLMATATGGATTAAAPTLRLAARVGAGFDTLDPALAYDESSWSLLWASCTTLMDLPGSRARGSHTLVPGGAAGFPRISADGRTYTFTIRRDLRFSDGTQIRAAHYAHALGRIRNSTTRSQIGFLADDVEWVRASGFTLRIRLEAPRGDFLSRAALPFTCPVPLGFPVDAAGVDLTVGSGPYYVGSRTRGQRIVLRPNRFYRGPYKARFAAIDFSLGGTSESLIRDTDAGRIDYAFESILDTERVALVRRYGIGRGRLHYRPGLDISYLAFNLRRGVFSRDVRLRRAINFALDRPEILRQGVSTRKRTDQILPPSTPGFRDASIYPLGGANLRAGRRLAGTRLSGRTVVLYSRASPSALREAEVIAYNLHALGVKVVVKSFATRVLFEKLTTPGEPWDLTGTLFWLADFPDPYDFVGTLFVTPPGSGSPNVSGFANPELLARIRAADRRSSAARHHALGELEIELMREHAPVAPISASQAVRLVSPRLGCITFNAMGALDLRRACMRY